MQREAAEKDGTAAEVVNQEVAMMQIEVDGGCGAAIRGGGGGGNGPAERCRFYYIALILVIKNNMVKNCTY